MINKTALKHIFEAQHKNIIAREAGLPVTLNQQDSFTKDGRVARVVDWS